MGETAVLIRIGLHVLAGWLYGSGYVGAKVRNILTSDPAVAAAGGARLLDDFRRLARLVADCPAPGRED